MTVFLDVLRFVSVAAQGASILIKTVDLVDSGRTIHGLLKKATPLDAEEKTKLAAEIAVATFKTLDIAASGGYLLSSHTSHAPLFKSIRIKTGLLSGVSSINKALIPLRFKKNRDRSDILNLAGVIFFHVGDVSGAVCSEPKFSEAVHLAFETAYLIAELAGAILIGYSSRKKLQNGALIIAKWSANFFNQIRGRSAASNPKIASASADEQIPAMFPPSHINDKLKIAKYYEDVVDKVITNWSKLEEIPEEVHHHPILQKIICPITKQPVRFAVSPANNDLIVYERDKIKEYLADGELPPDWPEGLIFSSNNIKKNNFAQYLIDRVLAEIAEDWSQARENVERSRESQNTGNSSNKTKKD